MYFPENKPIKLPMWRFNHGSNIFCKLNLEENPDLENYSFVRVPMLGDFANEKPIKYIPIRDIAEYHLTKDKNEWIKHYSNFHSRIYNLTNDEVFNIEKGYIPVSYKSVVLDINNKSKQFTEEEEQNIIGLLQSKDIDCNNLAIELIKNHKITNKIAYLLRSLQFEDKNINFNNLQMFVSQYILGDV